MQESGLNLWSIIYRSFLAADRERANTNARLRQDDDAAALQRLLDRRQVREDERELPVRSPV